MDPIMQQQSLPSPEQDDEGKMAKADLYKTARYALKLFKMMDDSAQLEGWIQAKITKAADYMASVYHYLEYEMKFNEYGQKLEMSDMYTTEEKRILRNKLMEAKDKMKALKKAQAEKMKKKDEKKDEKVEEATGFTAKDKRKGKVDTSTKSQYSVKLMHRDGNKTKNVHYDADEGESEGEVRDRAGRDHKSQGYSVDSIRKKTAENTMAQPKPTNPKYKGVTNNIPSPPDGASAPPPSNVKTREGQKLSKKDYDGDGKKETPKDEVWGSRAKAAAKSGKPFSEAKKAKPDFLDMDKDGNKKEPMKKAVKDKKVSESAKCNHTAKGKSCPVHGMKECSMEEAFDPLKHVKNPTKGEKDAAKDVKRSSYKDRAALLKSAERDGRLKTEAQNAKQQAAIAMAKKKKAAA